MENIDWSQSKVVFIAKSFNVYQLGAIAGNLPIELWRYSVFEGKIISLEQLTPPISNPSVSSLKGKISNRVEREIKVYTLEDHLLRRNATIKEIHQKLREEILNMNDQIREKVKKKYIAYELGRNFTELVIQANAIWVYLDVNISRLNDPRRVAEDCTEVGHWGTGDARFRVTSLSEVPYAVSLIKQAYEKRL
jgi:predicted transport protein